MKMTYTRLVFSSLMACLLAACLAASARAVDVIQLNSGTRMEGTIIAEDETSVTIQWETRGETYSRKVMKYAITSITRNGEQSDGGGTSTTPSTGTRPPTGTTPSTAGPTGSTRSEAEVKALIDRMGRAAPDWYDGTKLNYPQTLDLNWPQPAPGPWNANKNVGQYVWERINPNPSRWREGIRLMHYLGSMHRNNPEVRARVYNSLGQMYYQFELDYARAAFWWQYAGADQGGPDGVKLAECYAKLGNKQMAINLLQRIPLQFSTIKAYADMGEIQKALQIADPNLRGAYGDVAGVYAGDACRVAGLYDKAIEYYKHVLSMQAPAGRTGDRIRRNQIRARETMAAIQLYNKLDLARIPDGTYQASAMAYKAPVTVSITVENHRIVNCRVTKHDEPQSYAAPTVIPQRIVKAQGVKGIDAISNATITSEAILNAAAKALASGAR